MKLPQQLTTVTNFSKFIAMVFFILFPFVGFFVGMKYQQAIDRTKTSESIPMATPTPKFIPPSEGQNQLSCTSDSDCQAGDSCMVAGPIIAGQPVQKICVQKGQALPF